MRTRAHLVVVRSAQIGELGVVRAIRLRRRQHCVVHFSRAGEHGAVLRLGAREQRFVLRVERGEALLLRARLCAALFRLRGSHPHHLDELGAHALHLRAALIRERVRAREFIAELLLERLRREVRAPRWRARWAARFVRRRARVERRFGRARGGAPPGEGEVRLVPDSEQIDLGGVLRRERRERFFVARAHVAQRRGERSVDPRVLLLLLLRTLQRAERRGRALVRQAQLRFDLALRRLPRVARRRDRDVVARRVAVALRRDVEQGTRARALGIGVGGVARGVGACLFLCFRRRGEADQQLLLLHIKALLDGDEALLHHVALLLRRCFGVARRREAVDKFLREAARDNGIALRPRKPRGELRHRSLVLSQAVFALRLFAPRRGSIARRRLEALREARETLLRCLSSARVGSFHVRITLLVRHTRGLQLCRVRCQKLQGTLLPRGERTLHPNHVNRTAPHASGTRVAEERGGSDDISVSTPWGAERRGCEESETVFGRAHIFI